MRCRCSFLRNNELIVTIRLKIRSDFTMILTLSIPIPFESSKQVSIIDKIRNRQNIEIKS